MCVCVVRVGLCGWHMGCMQAVRVCVRACMSVGGVWVVCWLCVGGVRAACLLCWLHDIWPVYWRCGLYAGSSLAICRLHVGCMWVVCVCVCRFFVLRKCTLAWAHVKLNVDHLSLNVFVSSAPTFVSHTAFALSLRHKFRYPKGCVAPSKVQG